MVATRTTHLAIALMTALLCQACATGTGSGPNAAGLKASGPDRFDAKTNLISGFPATNSDGTINVVVEIPAGTSDKWEVNANGTALVRDYTGNVPRTIDYLPYPGNYGIIPSTFLAADKGGDDSPLDVLVLGPAVPRGSVIVARPIGLIRVLDRMEQDDKILAVMLDSTMQNVMDLEGLRRGYPGAGEIVETWFLHAHGRQSKVMLLGAGSRGQASAVIDFASETYEKSAIAKSLK